MPPKAGERMFRGRPFATFGSMGPVAEGSSPACSVASVLGCRPKLCTLCSPCGRMDGRPAEPGWPSGSVGAAAATVCTAEPAGAERLRVAGFCTMTCSRRSPMLTPFMVSWARRAASAVT